MNRADQAPEPSMEELLASIRLIISDADRKAPSIAREGGFSRSLANLDTPEESGEGDEVLDLTDDLVLAGDAGPAADLLSQPTERPNLEERQQPSVPKETRRDAPAAPALPMPPARRPEPAAASRREPSEPAAASKPVWSRREIPFPGAGFEPSAPRPRGEPQPQPPKPQQGKAWSGDVQMAVPERGPVPLIPSSEQEKAEPSWPKETDSPDEAALAFERDEESAVAALAHKLARSAIGAMEPEELQTAREVDFEHAGEGSKAEVTERFADAIARESATISKPALPGLLNEALRQDFRREAKPAGNSKAFDPLPPAAPESPDEWDAAFEEHTGVEPRTPQAPAPAAAAHREQNSVPQPQAQAQNMEQPSPAAVMAVPAASQALVPAQSALPASASRSLEEAVRDMLRPLLVQWLNENMPRILESAIREEIAARGLFPNRDS